MTLTFSQQEVLRRAQLLPDNAVFSRRNFGARQATMQALLYAKCIAWVDDIETGYGRLSYYRLTEAGKTAEVRP